MGVPADRSNQNTINNDSTASTDISLTSSGAVFVYKRTGAIWAQEAYIKSHLNNGNRSLDYFGSNIALYGDRLAVSAKQDNSNPYNNGLGANTGMVYIYKRTGSSWALESLIKAINADADSGEFGGGGNTFSQSLAMDNDTLVVGAPGEDSNQTTIINGTTASTNGSSSNSNWN